MSTPIGIDLTTRRAVEVHENLASILINVHVRGRDVIVAAWGFLDPERAGFVTYVAPHDRKSPRRHSREMRRGERRSEPTVALAVVVLHECAHSGTSHEP
jgi:ribosomal protein L32